jgi:hypothetical protein
MFVQRRNGLIVGCYRALQPGIAEELLADNAPEVIAFLNANPDARLLQDIFEASDCRLDASIMSLVNMDKSGWLAWAGTNFPTLTAAERARLGNLFWVVAIGVRRSLRSGF